MNRIYNVKFRRIDVRFVFVKMSSVIVAMGILFTGCSIKEDRSICPCLMMLDFKEEVSFIDRVVGVNVMADDYFYTDSICVPKSAICALQIPRKENLRVAIAYGCDDLWKDGEGVLIPKGKDAPECWLYCNDFSSVGETCSLKVNMRKNFCKLKIRFVAPEAMSSYSCHIVGNVAGFSSDGSPVAGDFMYRILWDEAGESMINLPRQTDDSLLLTIGSSDEGDIVDRAFCIGKYIEQTGYDWNAPDLEDITIVIDYVQADIKVIVADWEKVFSFDIVI